MRAVLSENRVGVWGCKVVWRMSCTRQCACLTVVAGDTIRRIVPAVRSTHGGRMCDATLLTYLSAVIDGTAGRWVDGKHC